MGTQEKVPTKVRREETNSLTNVCKITNKITSDSEDGSVPNNSVTLQMKEQKFRSMSLR